jgi:two-component system cell cycle sensor histidine kinase/response regulator CckA
MTDTIEQTPPHVLVVDDDEIIREIGNKFLTEAGFAVSEAKNGLQALRALDRIHPDIILMDVMMPEMDGFATATAVRYLPGFEGIPILIMTALDDMDSINRAYKAGATDFIMKPINWTILVQRIRYMTRAARIMKRQQQLQKELVQAQKMEAIGALAGGVAHDLNNILAGIVSYPDLLLFRIPEDSPLRQPIQTIKKSGEKAAAIVQDLLTLARRNVVTHEAVNMNDIIEEYLNSPEHAKLMSYHNHVRIVTHLDEHLLDILGSPVHLSKTIMNLVSNAAEAIRDGGRIDLKTETRFIERRIGDLDVSKTGEYVIVSVSDTGIGMSAEESEKIFEPFFTKKKMGRSGTGLGMSVVWGTVKDHDGHIRAETAKGKGTTFHLYFPVTRQARNKVRSSSPTEAHRGNGERILVIDDAEEQREIACMMLSQLGYKAKAVSSGEEGVAFMQQHSADLILLDMIMDPGIDGLETYKRIIKLHPGQKAVIVSGYSQTEQVEMTQQLGAGQYLKKPYILEKIAKAIKSELAK